MSKNIPPLVSVALLTLLVTVLISHASGGVPVQKSNKICRAQKIHVTDMGSSPQAMNFRHYLEKWLAKKKFTVVYRPEDADAVLTGKFSSTSGIKRSNLSFRDAELRSPQGVKLWTSDYDITKRNSFMGFGRGHLEDGAIRIVKDIRAACE